MAIVFAGLAVADIEPARGWYERLFGRPADILPHDREAVWQLAEGGWVYVVEDADRVGKGLLTLLVDDLEAELSELAERGLEPGPIDIIPGAVRKAAIVDPDGNRITFGQPLT